MNNFVQIVDSAVQSESNQEDEESNEPSETEDRVLQ